jgi:hypothetical protein
MTTVAQLRAAWLAVARVPLAVPVAASLLLAVLTVPWHDTRGTQVVHGVAVLLAAALAAASDDPSGEVADAAATTRRSRSLVRLGVVVCAVVPLFVAGLVAVHLQASWVPGVLLSAEAVGFGVLALAVGFGLRRWRGMPAPAYPAVLGLLLGVVALNSLPRAYTVIDAQAWGPPYDGAMIRWAGLALALLGVLVAALRDPAE